MMPWLETAFPVRMARVALVAPEESVRAMLVRVAGSGVVEIDAEPPGQAHPAAAVCEQPPDLAALERAGRADLVAGEAQVRHYSDAAARGHGAAALAGWAPAGAVPGLTAALAEVGAAAVPLRRPREEAPTLVAQTAGQRALSPIVSAYGTMPYADVNPAWLAWASYVAMFGMMFGDVAEGLALVAAGVALWLGWPGRARPYRTAWPFVLGAGVAATGFGFAYGEFFGPTGVVPVLWLSPVDEPVPLLIAAIGVGAVLLAGA